ncbi:hypothetical protein QUC31_006692 [Theobroma cacao]
MEPGKSQAPSPHILIFPLPIQGPVNAMLKLAELCATAGLKVTFLNSEYNHSRLVRFANIPSRFDKYPGFEFRTISDGLPGDHPRSGNRFMEIFEAMNIRTKPLLKDMLVEMIPPVDCIIGDGILEFVLDVANELGIPIINCRTIGACFLWSNYSIPDMIEAGELPIKGSEDMDRPITAVPGMEKFLRCRDLPSFCRASNMSDSTLLRYGAATFTVKIYSCRTVGHFNQEALKISCKMEKGEQSEACPHVLIFPLPLQGHVNSMFKLAELLALTGFKVTFLYSEHNHGRLVKYTNVSAHFASYPGFEFRTVPDGLPDDHPRSGDWFLEMYYAMETKAKLSLREMLLNINPPVDCIIGDGFLGFVLDVAKELGIPVFYFRTSSACCFWAYYSIPDIIQAGEIPIRGKVYDPMKIYF